MATKKRKEYDFDKLIEIKDDESDETSSIYESSVHES